MFSRVGGDREVRAPGHELLVQHVREADARASRRRAPSGRRAVEPHSTASGPQNGRRCAESGLWRAVLAITAVHPWPGATASDAPQRWEPPKCLSTAADDRDGSILDSRRKDGGHDGAERMRRICVHCFACVREPRSERVLRATATHASVGWCHAHRASQFRGKRRSSDQWRVHELHPGLESSADKPPQATGLRGGASAARQPLGLGCEAPCQAVRPAAAESLKPSGARELGD